MILGLPLCVPSISMAPKQQNAFGQLFGTLDPGSWSRESEEWRITVKDNVRNRHFWTAGQIPGSWVLVMGARKMADRSKGRWVRRFKQRWNLDRGMLYSKDGGSRQNITAQVSQKTQTQAKGGPRIGATNVPKTWTVLLGWLIKWVPPNGQKLGPLFGPSFQFVTPWRLKSVGGGFAQCTRAPENEDDNCCVSIVMRPT